MSSEPTWYEYARSLGYRNPMYLPQEIKNSIIVPKKPQTPTNEEGN